MKRRAMKHCSLLINVLMYSTTAQGVTVKLQQQEMGNLNSVNATRRL